MTICTKCKHYREGFWADLCAAHPNDYVEGEFDYVTGSRLEGHYINSRGRADCSLQLCQEHNRDGYCPDFLPNPWERLKAWLQRAK